MKTQLPRTFSQPFSQPFQPAFQPAFSASLSASLFAMSCSHEVVPVLETIPEGLTKDLSGNSDESWSKTLHAIPSNESCSSTPCSKPGCFCDKQLPPRVLLEGGDVFLNLKKNKFHKLYFAICPAATTCICVDECNIDCPITQLEMKFYPNIGRWNEFGCGCNMCSDCGPLASPESCECDWGIEHRSSPLRHKCVREGCPCTSTHNGLEGGYCCRSCKKGTPCTFNKHSDPPPIKCHHCGTCVHNKSQLKKHLKEKDCRNKRK